MKSIFEAVDKTEDEIYFTIGLWPSLEDAIKFLEKHQDPTEFLDQDHDEFCLVEIRERAMGFSGVGEKIATIEWEHTYIEEEDEYQWRRKPAEIMEKL